MANAGVFPFFVLKLRPQTPSMGSSLCLSLCNANALIFGEKGGSSIIKFEF